MLQSREAEYEIERIEHDDHYFGHRHHGLDGTDLHNDRLRQTLFDGEEPNTNRKLKHIIGFLVFLGLLLLLSKR